MLSRAIILAAGIGSRLKPLTHKTPKALLKFRGKTMLEHVVKYLKKYGIKHIVINVHHHADQIIDFVRDNDSFGLSIEISDERNMLMDTGGGILKAKRFLQGHGPFLVHNVDIFTDLNLTDIFKYHEHNGALATLAVKDRKTSRNLLIGPEGELCGWRDNTSGEQIIARDENNLRRVAFSGIHIIEPEIFEVLHKNGPFSMIKAYLELAASHKIMTYVHFDDTWIDMARRENFKELC